MFLRWVCTYFGKLVFQVCLFPPLAGVAAVLMQYSELQEVTAVTESVCTDIAVILPCRNYNYSISGSESVVAALDRMQ